MTTVPSPPLNSSATNTAAALPHAMPPCPNARLALFAVRRMGAHGLSDAHVAHAFVNGFGEGFRRPLVLMRALMADLAAQSSCPIAIAPPCCARITSAEHAMLTILSRAETAPESARLLLADLLGIRRIDGVLASATAASLAFTDAGRPIGSRCELSGGCSSGVTGQD